MTTDEARANAIFTRLRDSEVESRWEKEGDLANFAGMDFYSARKNGLGQPPRSGMRCDACPKVRCCTVISMERWIRSFCWSTQTRRQGWR